MTLAAIRARVTGGMDPGGDDSPSFWGTAVGQWQHRAFLCAAGNLGGRQPVCPHSAARLALRPPTVAESPNPAKVTTMTRLFWPRYPQDARRARRAAASRFATGCGSLEQKERELDVSRAVKGDAGWYSGLPAGVQEVYLPVGDAPDAQKIHAWWWPDARSEGARRLLPARLALEPHRPRAAHRAVAQLRILGVRDRLSRLRQERRRPSVRADGVRGRARRLGVARAASAGSRAALHLRSLAGRRGRDRPRGELRRHVAAARRRRR